MRENRVLQWALYVSYSRMREVSLGIWNVDGDQKPEVCLLGDLDQLDGQKPVRITAKFWKHCPKAEPRAASGVQ